MRTRTYHLTWLFILGIACLPSLGLAQDYAVVVHPKNECVITKNDVAKIFLGKMKKFPGGGEAIPVMQDSKQEITKVFVKAIVKKTWTQFRSYWSRMMFSGKGYPPKRLVSDDAVKTSVSANVRYIGIISNSAVDDSVKVVARF